MMMDDTAAQREFAREALTLGASEALATLAVLVAEKDAAPALIGAAIKVWERQYGNAHALELTRIALATVTKAADAPDGRH